MKKYNFIISSLSAIFVLIITSCSDFLDKQPTTQVASGTFWKTTQDVDKAVIGVYASFRTVLYSSYAVTNSAIRVSPEVECFSDNALTSTGDYIAIMQGGTTASTGGAMSNFWRDAYLGIAAANYFLDNVDKAASLYSETDLNAIKAEVRFIRAFFYDSLVQLYGNVPVSLHSEQVGSGYDKLPRTKKADIVKDVILPDVDFAIANLPNTAYSGHAVKGSAVVLKMRVLLNNLRYAEAAQLGGDYIQGKAPYGTCPFKLYSNYGGIFYKEQMNNPEVIFSVMFSAPDDHHTLDQEIGSRMAVFPSVQLRDSYEAGDKRRKQTIFEIGDNWINNDKTHTFNQDGNRAESTIPFTQMAFKKYVDTTLYVPSASTPSAQHIIKMRYADLLLMYAEAMFESGKGNDATALAALNSVRARAGLAPLTELTREKIRNERRVELAFEELRYNDIIRWGIADVNIPQIVYDSNGTKRKFDGYVWPVPQSQMDIMQEWEQNPKNADYNYYKSISYLP
jgi:hypothetical protein